MIHVTVSMVGTQVGHYQKNVWCGGGFGVAAVGGVLGDGSSGGKRELGGCYRRHFGDLSRPIRQLTHGGPCSANVCLGTPGSIGVRFDPRWSLALRWYFRTPTRLRAARRARSADDRAPATQRANVCCKGARAGLREPLSGEPARGTAPSARSALSHTDTGYDLAIGRRSPAGSGVICGPARTARRLLRSKVCRTEHTRRPSAAQSWGWQ